MNLSSEQSTHTAIGFGLRRHVKQLTLDVNYVFIATEIAYELIDLFVSQFKLAPTGNDFKTFSFDDLATLFQILSASDARHQELNTLLKTLIELGRPQSVYGQSDYVLYLLRDGKAVVSTPEEAYFKLHLISHRHVQPHGVNLDGAFKVLQNCAWSNIGPILVDDLPQERLKALVKGAPLVISHVDKFPYLVNYHVPSGVRIAAGSQVRLGAYLGEGTTVMPAGYVNFNAGTAGQAMVEGRVSAGVFVGDKTDIGGGASIMGTLSGGNKHVISLGRECLLGANAGTGISLGDGCTIAAGVYITAGTKVSLYNHQSQPVDLQNQVVSEGQNIVKALELDGRSHLLFYQDSQNGKVICKPNPRTIELNSDLHKHN